MLVNSYEKVLGTIEEHPLRLGEHCFPDRSHHKSNSLTENDLLASLMEESAFLSLSLLFKKH